MGVPNIWMPKNPCKIQSIPHLKKKRERKKWFDERILKKLFRDALLRNGRMQLDDWCWADFGDYPPLFLGHQQHREAERGHTVTHLFTKPKSPETDDTPILIWSPLFPVHRESGWTAQYRLKVKYPFHVACKSNQMIFSFALSSSSLTSFFLFHLSKLDQVMSTNDSIIKCHDSIQLISSIT